MDAAEPSTAGDAPGEGPRFACPMDPQIVSADQDRCLICGMKLLPIALVPAALELLEGQDHAGQSAVEEHHGPCDGSIEWEDTMVEINRATDPLHHAMDAGRSRDGEAQRAGRWTFAVGNRVKIGSRTRWTPITRCTTPSTSTARDGS